MPEPELLCWCGHKRSAHTHLRHSGRPVDCGHCGLAGDTACLMFTPRAKAPFNEAQRRAGQAADEQLLRNLLALQRFALRRQDVQIPAQRRPMKSIAGQFAQHLRDARRNP